MRFRRWSPLNPAALALLSATISGCASGPAPLPASRLAIVDRQAPEDEKVIDTKVARFTFRASARANLAYQLDCMSRAFACSAQAFEKLWRQDLGWSSEDDELLSTWRAIRIRYGGRVEIQGETRETRLPIPRTWLQIRNAVYLASILASSDGEHEKLLRLFMRPDDVKMIRRIEAHFEPRFSAWWETTGQPTLNRFLNDTEGLLRDRRAQDVLEGAYRFYAANDVEPVFTLIARPSHDSPLFGRQLSEYSFFEVGVDDIAKRRLFAMMHELMHTLYALGDRERLANLSNSFADSDHPLAIPFYNLLNEALATALANGLLAEALGESDADRRLYHEEDVHRAALASIPLVRSILDSGKSFYDHESFPDNYVSAMQKAFPSGLPVTNHLQPLILLYGKRSPNLFDHISRATQASSRGGLAANDAISDAESIELLRRFPSWPILVVLAKGEVDQLSKLEDLLSANIVAEVGGLAKAHSAFVYSGYRPMGKGFVSIIVAPEESTALRLFDTWMTQPTLPTLPATFYE